MHVCMYGYILSFSLSLSLSLTHTYTHVGIKLPGKFVTPEEKNGRGGVEFAFMSVTTLREVAVSYIDADKVCVRDETCRERKRDCA